MLRRPLVRSWCPALFGALVLCAGASASAQEPPPEKLTPDVALARATGYYETGRYEECSAAFSQLLARADAMKELGLRGVEKARLYYAACLFATGNADQADEQFRAAILANPQISTPSSIIFPQVVVDRFLLVRESLLEELRRAQEERARRAREDAARAAKRARAERSRIEQLEKLAGEETVIVKNSRWLASVPFGVGQFQNRNYALGAVLLTSEVLLAGTALTATSIQLSLHSQASGRELTESETRNFNTNLDTAQAVIIVATSSFLGVAALGILEANLSFVPEFRVGTRPRSATSSGHGARRKQSAWSAGAFALPSGGGVGVRGSF